MSLHVYHAMGNRPASTLSGRKVPRDGGVILAVGQSHEQIEAIMSDDPFVAAGLSEFRVIEFRASQRAQNVAELIAREPAR